MPASLGSVSQGASAMGCQANSPMPQATAVPPASAMITDDRRIQRPSRLSKRRPSIMAAISSAADTEASAMDWLTVMPPWTANTLALSAIGSSDSPTTRMMVPPTMGGTSQRITRWNQPSAPSAMTMSAPGISAP
ncbi:MAG: hypothetical protein GAK34_03199 [Delftia tsuruhatensis]|nr:MAG: hypothetical protein GAK34_03199 [Delftia tsuruhatensis]